MRQNFDASRAAVWLFGSLATIGAGAGPARAETPAEFYKGKTVSIVIGTSAGNDYDLRGRLIGKYLQRYIPGQPTVVVRNMPGAGGITAANHLAALAPRDGTSLHMIMSNMMSSQALGVKGVKFDTRDFAWIGNSTSVPNVMATWLTSPVKTIADARVKTALMGAPTGTAGALYGEVMNAVLKTKFNLVTGYPGGVEVNLAMERGEVDGRASNSWAAWKANNADWLAAKKLNFLVQIGLERHPELPDTPLLIELAENEADRRILTFVSADTAISRSLVASPGVPPDRIEALRRAFDAVMKDPQFLADAERSKMDVSAMTGEEAQKIADSIVNTPPDVIERARAFLEPK